MVNEVQTSQRLTVLCRTAGSFPASHRRECTSLPRSPWPQTACCRRRRTRTFRMASLTSLRRYLYSDALGLLLRTGSCFSAAAPETGLLLSPASCRRHQPKLLLQCHQRSHLEEKCEDVAPETGSRPRPRPRRLTSWIPVRR